MRFLRIFTYSAKTPKTRKHPFWGGTGILKNSNSGGIQRRNASSGTIFEHF
jgi:hypothetical protein